MKRRFWVLRWEAWTGGYDGGEYEGIAVFWGTWMEAAREVVRRNKSIRGYRLYRKVEPFDLPDVSRKKKAFFVVE